MIVLLAIILCSLVFFIATVLWYLLSLLLGALGTAVLAPFLMAQAMGILTSIGLVFAQKNKTSIPNFILSPIAMFIFALGLIVPTSIVVLPFQQSPLIFVYLYITVLFALFASRSLLNKLTLKQKEDESALLIRFLKVLGLSCFVSAIIIPFYFMIFSSITPRAIFLQNPLNLAPRFNVGLGNLFEGYREVMTTFNFGRFILNSLLVSCISVILTLVPSTLGAYAVTRLHFPGQNFLSRSILLIYMFPTIVLAIPLYSVFATLGLRDSLVGLLIVYPAITIPVSLYMLRNYFTSLPKDIEEAGIIDGCSRLSVIWRITIPLSLPALLAVGLYIFMIAWNEFLFAFMFLDNTNIFTLSRGIVSLNSQEVPRQFLMAGAIIITVPVMVIFFSLERYFTGGLVAGGVKG